jgi:hypothetical protein
MGEIITDPLISENKPELSTFIDDSFKGKYTTNDKILSDTSVEKKESNKTVLSNDFYMLGQQIECLLNKMVK